MPDRIPVQDASITLKFGGGLATRAPEDEITDREAADGRNFVLDILNAEFINRKPFDFVAQAANYGSINGGGNVIKSDGSIGMFIQAGNTVYEYDGSTFLSATLDTVNANAKLRGHWRTQNSQLDNKVIITDLALLEVVKEWDGTTWADVTFTDQSGSGFGTFYAKYCTVLDERAIFAHVKDASSTLPHMVVASDRSDYTVITNTLRAGAVSAADAFFLLSPDLKPINGLLDAFGSLLISTDKGRLFDLTGSDASDFAFNEFYGGSSAVGDEALTYVGNDIFYGRAGRIESLKDTDRFGDAEANDLTIQIADRIEGYGQWTIVYNSRLDRVYAFPDSVSECWYLNKAVRDAGELSPWVRWTTSHSMAFQPTFVQAMLDPADGLEYVFMGDSGGNLYRLEGTGTAGDGGSADIRVESLSKLFVMPEDAKAFDIDGYLKYRRGDLADISLTLETQGEEIESNELVVTLPNASGGPYYNNSSYYNNGEYYGTSGIGKLERVHFTFPGGSNEFQIRVRYDGTKDIEINEIGLRFKASGD